ncbi:glutathione S-transferase family protein [Alteromonas flava]|uniref:glutathione S-transferase family protein n=1 Tax=Alteromonas flava TaxID=2048003 RepID=UPI000C28FC7F|nr:glutathione S-transferase family protein [Alteromonas flava]
MLKILSFPGTRGLRITWAAEELNIPYEYQLINLYQGEHKQPAYRSISPLGKVPVIQDGDLVIAESGAIVTHLADKVGRMIPTCGSDARGRFEQAMYFALTELEQPLWTIAKHTFVFPEEKRVPAIIEVAQWEFQQALKILNEMLADNEFILGADFSVADIITGQILIWAQNAKQPIPFDSISAYAERVVARPALKRAKEAEAQAKNHLQS